MSKYRTVALLAGGESSERRISFLSSEPVLESLKRMNYDVVKIDPDHTLAAVLQDIKVDVVFNCLHGIFGEDGTIPGLLEVMRIPYTHSGVGASAICFDKIATLGLAKQLNIPIAENKIYKLEELKAELKANRYPFATKYVIKPINQGSTIGVQIIDPSSEKPHLNDWIYGNKILVEKYIAGVELSCSVVRDKAIAVTELRPKSGFYDYDAKYTAGEVEHVVPADIPSSIYNRCMEISEKLHKYTGCRTVSRSDFRYNPAEGDKGLYFLEINTHPGLTALSIVPEAAAYNGISFDELIKILIDDAQLELTKSWRRYE